jgi:hypothetical protein
MGKIRVVSAMTGSVQDGALCGPLRDRDSDGDRPPPAIGQECSAPEIDTDVKSVEAPDFFRSRGYGRYEI